jgi:hypothetical protein
MQLKGLSLCLALVSGMAANPLGMRLVNRGDYELVTLAEVFSTQSAKLTATAGLRQ